MKTIISCPTCSKKMRIPINKNIQFQCVQCGTLIVADNGIITSSLQRVELKTSKVDIVINKLKRQPRIVYTVVFTLILILFGVSWCINSQKEVREFENLKKNPTIESIDDFVAKYPRGEFQIEAISLKDSVRYEEIVKDYEENKEKGGLGNLDCSRIATALRNGISFRPEKLNNIYEECFYYNLKLSPSFAMIDKYYENFEEGNFVDSVLILEKKIWADSKDQYLLHNNSNEIPFKTRKLMTELFDYGAKSRNRQISVIFNPTLLLKDWEDYSQEARTVVDTIFTLRNRANRTDYPMPTDLPPPSIKNAIQSSKKHLERTIISALQIRLDSLFVTNPFLVKNEEQSGDYHTYPHIMIDYNIEILTDNVYSVEFPVLYLYVQENRSNQELYSAINSEEKFLGFLLATSVEWDMEFKLPQSETRYEFKTTSRPEKHLSGARGKNDAYQIMLSSTFEDYALQIAEKFGF